MWNVESITISRTVVANSSAVSDFIWCTVIDDVLYLVVSVACNIEEQYM